MDTHVERMKALIGFTRSSLDTEYPSPFGCAIYSSQGVLLSQRYDSVLRDNDVTAHGEVNAIRDACKVLLSISLAGCVLYSTCEPCPMCMSSAIWAEVACVVFGAVTLLDAHGYWPQASTLRPRELLAYQSADRQPVGLIEEVCRADCQELFRLVDAKRTADALQLPPHRK
jgi:tRNA(Arg) A34 adenosine deaminase TadA